MKPTTFIPKHGIVGCYSKTLPHPEPAGTYPIPWQNAEAPPDPAALLRRAEKAEAELRDCEARFHNLFMSANDAMLLTSRTESIRDANHKAEILYGYSRNELQSLTVFDLHPPGLDRTPRRPAANRPVETVARRKNGGYFTVEYTVTEYEVTGKHYFLYIVRDYTSHRQERETYYRKAFFDDLTGLANRNLFLLRLKEALSAADSDSPMALLYIDLNNFKVINDTHRHQTGDKVLQVVAGRLKGCVRESDMVGRLHGDEFVVALRDLDRSRLPDILQSRIRRIQSIISEPMGVDGVSLETSAAVGAALYPDDADDAEALLDIADAAMFQNKKNNRG